MLFDMATKNTFKHFITKACHELEAMQKSGQIVKEFLHENSY